MAVLGKIRERTFFLILIIGVALFAFVISGVFDKSPQTMPTAVGVVNGEEIPYAEFRSQVEGTLNRIGRNSEIGTMYVVNTLWKQAVQAKILNQQFEKLGISVGKDQIMAAVSKSPEFVQNPEFHNANGVFDPNKFAQYIATLKEVNPQAFSHWQLQEEQLAEASKYRMYLSLVRAGLGATATEGELAYRQEVEKADIQYVMLPYSSIADADVKVSDTEIEKYIKKHQKEFQTEEGRNIQYVVVREQATKEDKQQIFDELKQLENPTIRFNAATQKNETLEGFAKLPVGQIADFVNENSDIPYDSLYVTKEKLPAVATEQLLALQPEQLYGPYEDNGYYKLSRVLGKVNNAEVRASHILIGYKGSVANVPNVTRTKAEAEKKAKELLVEARKNGVDFGKLATENSDDKGTLNGDLNFFARGTMVKPFNDYVFSHKVGDVGLVETDFGFHIIKITDQKEGVQLATLARLIEPSQKTRDEAYVKATTFEVNATDNPKKFIDFAQEQDLQVIPATNLQITTEHIIGLGINRSVVHWAFNKETKLGNVKRFDIKDGYVIAQLTRKTEKGLRQVEDARSLVEPILIKQKKAQELVKKITGSTLDEVAKNTEQSIQYASNLSIKSQMLTGAGIEPRVVGVAFALDENKLSKPIEGENGVFVIQVTKKQVAPELPSYGSYTNSLRLLKENRASVDLLSTLEQAAEIEDNRFMFY